MQQAMVMLIKPIIMVIKKLPVVASIMKLALSCSF